MASTRIPSIQWLRATAASLVLMVHASDAIDAGAIATTGRFAPSIPNLAAFGASGVDLFFVISGFVMAHALHHGDGGALRFLTLRWLRIVPLFTGVSLVYIAIMPHPPTWPAALMSLTVLPLVNDGADHGPALYPGWSLGFEFAFYALVALVFSARRHRVPALLAMTIAVALAGLVVRPGWAPLRLLFNPLMLEFALGILVWITWRRGIGTRTAAVALVGGITLLAIGLAVGLGADVSVDIASAIDGSSGLARSWTWGVPWALVTIGLVDSVSNTRAARIITAIGNASYSTYLVHPCLIALLWMQVGSLPPVCPTLFVAGFVIASTLAGLACHRWIERPLLAQLTRPHVAVSRGVIALG